MRQVPDPADGPQPVASAAVARAPRGQRTPMALAALVIGVLYSVTGAAGLVLLHRLAAPGIAVLSPALIVPWLPVGLGVAGLLHFGLRAWPGIAVGSILVWGVLQGDPWSGVLSDAVGETASIVLIVILLRRWDFRLALDRYRDPVVLVVALMLGRAVAVLIDVLVAVPLSMVDPRAQPALDASGFTEYSVRALISAPITGFMFRWWANSTIGGILVVPLLQFVEAPARSFGPRPVVTALVLSAALSVWSAAVWLVPGGSSLAACALVEMIGVALLVPWAGIAWAAVTIFVATLVMTFAIAFQAGIFAAPNLALGTAGTWAVLSAVTAITLFLASHAGQLARARQQLAAVSDRLRVLFEQSPFPMWIESADGTVERANQAAIRAYGAAQGAGPTAPRAERVVEALDPRTLAGIDLLRGARAERHRMADGQVQPVAVLTLPLAHAPQARLCCVAEPLAERLEMYAATTSASELERFRLATDLSQAIRPLVLRIREAAHALEEAIGAGGPADPRLVDGMARDAATTVAHCRRITRGVSSIDPAGGLAGALRELPDVLQRDGVAVEAVVDPAAVVPAERSEAFYRTAVESAQLLLMQPGLRTLRIALEPAGAVAQLTVEGDLAFDAFRPDDLALRSLRARAFVAGGAIRIGPGPTGATRIELSEVAAGGVPPPAAVQPVTDADPPAQPAESLESLRALLTPDYLRRLGMLLGAHVVAGVLAYALLQRAPVSHATWDVPMVLPILANGVGVAALWSWGYRYWPAVFLGSVLVWLGLAGDPWLVVFFDAAAASLATIVTVWLLRRWRFAVTFDRFRDLYKLLGAAAVGCGVTYALDTLAIDLLAMLDPALAHREIVAPADPAGLLRVVNRAALVAGFRWWVGGILGTVFAVTGLLSVDPDVRTNVRVRRREFVVLLALAVGVTVAMLATPLFDLRIVLMLVAAVLGLWAATRFGTAVSAWVTLLNIEAIAYGSIARIGIFAGLPFEIASLMAWRGTIFVGSLVLFLSVIVARERRTLTELAAAAAEHRTLFDALPQATFAYARDTGRVLVANRWARERLGLQAGMRITDLDRSGDTQAVLMGPEPPRGVERDLRDAAGRASAIEVTAADIEMDGVSARLCVGVDVTERRRLRARVLEAADSAREQLARDLHDGLGQALTGLGLGIAGLSGALAAGRELSVDTVRFVAHAADAVVRDTERLARGVSALGSVGGDLLAAVRALPEPLPPSARSRLAVTTTAEAPVRISLAEREHVFQLVREATNNALKHALAERILISLHVDAQAIDVRVEDNGTGIDRATSGGGLGLSSMASRAARLRGRLAITSRPGGGTVVHCRVPNVAAAAG